MKKRKTAGEQTLRLEWRTPEELADNPANWRRHPTSQMRAMGAMLDEVGWAGAALFNEKTGRLIDGHLRKSMALTRREKVPVLVGSWTEAQEKTILALLDPLGDLASSDGAAMRELAASVKTDSDALAAMLEDLGKPPKDLKPEPVKVQNPPRMTWVLIGIPLDRYGDVYDHVVALQKVASISVQSSRDK